MKYIRHIMLAATLMVAMAYLPSVAQNRVVPKAYMFGFAASFNDSIVFFTDIQEVDSVWIMPHKKLLAGKCTYRAKAEKELNEIIAFFDHIGIKDDRKDKLIASLEGEAEEWWECYQNTQQELAARAWIKLGRCLDDDIY